MSRRRHNRGKVSHERWLVSYADFITLLFAFFVVLYSSSQVDRKKATQLAVAIQVAFRQLGVFQPPAGQPLPKLDPGSGAIPVQLDPKALAKLVSEDSTGQGGDRNVERLMQTLQRTLAPEIARQEVRLHAGPDGIVLSLQEIGFYDPGSDTLRSGADAFLHRLVPVLETYVTRMRIEGHTDNVPIHNPRFGSNWELSTARATNLVQVLINQYHLPAERLSAAGYAEFHPTATNRTADGRRLNRRVDLVILEAVDPETGAGMKTGVVSTPSSATTPPAHLSSTTSGLATRVLSPSR